MLAETSTWEDAVELSDIVKEYGVPLTRSERGLVSRLDSVATLSTPLGERDRQRMKDLAAARETLRQLPDRDTMQRRDRMDKAARLKERLKLLRQSIPFLSPSAVKALKAEMRQIASQLASLGGSGGSGGMPVMVDTPAVESDMSGNEAGNGPDSAPADEAHQPGDAARSELADTADDSTTEQAAKSAAAAGEERQLKEAVEELKGLFKAVLAELNRKQRSARDGKHSGVAPGLRVYAGMPVISSSLTFKV